MITFYNAGAGSGKTYTLTSKLLEFLINDLGKPSQIILTTFTKKAAEELKERVRQLLIKENKPEKAAEMASALIGTVNSICSQLVERYALEAGLSPDLQVLDENAAAVFFEEFLASQVPDPVFKRFSYLCGRFSLYEQTEWRTTDMGKPRWPGMVKILAEKFRLYNYTDRSQFAASRSAACQAIADFLQARDSLSLEAVMDRLVGAFAGIPDDPDFTSSNDTDRIIQGRSSLSKIVSGSFNWGDWHRIGFESYNKGAIKLYPELESITDTASEYFRLPEFKDEWTELTTLVYDTAWELSQSYRNYKDERGMIDYVDQESLLLQMLETNPVVQEEIKATYRLIMVDEFQDSSPIQLALFSRFHKLIGRSVWVGDPKQSIYGFRDADVTLFSNTVQALEQGGLGEIKVLDTSYRSRPDLVSVSNRIFGGLFGDLLLKSRIHLQPARDSLYRETTYNKVALHLWFFEDRSNEAYFRQLARGVEVLLRSDFKVFDKNAESFRPLKGGDIALLAMTNSDLMTLASELKSLGIPVAVETEGLALRAEVWWIKSLLRLVMNTNDSLAIANLSLLEGTSKDVEDLIRRRLDHLSIEELPERWKEASLAAIEIGKEKERIAEMPLVQAVEYLVSLTSLPEYCARWGDYTGRMNNVGHIIRLATKYAGQCRVLGMAGTISGFLSHLEECKLSPADEQADAVQLMTVYKSKGLEWPVVIPVRLDKSDADQRVLFDRVHAMASGEFDLDNPLQGRQLVSICWPFGGAKNLPENLKEAAGRMDSNFRAHEKSRQEEDRLLYVALTRARDYLVLTANKKPKKTGSNLVVSRACLEKGDRDSRIDLFTVAHWQELFAQTESGQIRNIRWQELDVALTRFAPEEEIATEDTGPSVAAEGSVKFYDIFTQIPPAEYTKRYVNPSKIIILPEEDRDIKVRDHGFIGEAVSFNRGNSPDYEKTGSCLHAAFSSWNPDLSSSARIPLLQELLTRWQEHKYMDAAQIDGYFACFWEYVQNTFSPLRYWKELPFSSITSEAATITSGTADLVLETSRGLVLIDHKTFAGSFEKQVLNPEDEFYAGRHAAQLNAYKNGLKAASGKEIQATLVHYIFLGRVVELY